MNITYTKIMQTLRVKPFFWILVPVFFILKNSHTYFSAISFPEAIGLLAEYLAGACVLYFLLRLFMRTNYRAALCSFVLLTVYFFYGNFDQFLQTQKWLYPFSMYRWSLSALLLFLCLTLFFIARLKTAPGRAISFLNLLLIFFCCSEAIPLLYRSVSPRKPLLTMGREASPLAGIETEFPDPPASDTMSIVNNPAYQIPRPVFRPNIYFLLFDEYQGNAGLEKVFHYRNEALQTALADKGFFSPRMARSNYNFTFFSMPSIFNMNYLMGEIQGKDLTGDLLLFSSGIGLIQNSRLVEFLKTINYSVTDLSPFRLDDTAETVSQFQSITIGKDLIRDQTLFYMFKEKFGWLIDNKKWLRFIDPSDYNNQFYNEYVQKHLIAESTSPSHPKFVYAHLFIPHLPFLKDSSGNDIDFKEFMQKKESLGQDYLSARYLDYLKYANTVMTSTVDSLISNDPGAVIMIMSDHGYRGLAPKNKEWQYNIQFYLRTPEKNYSAWPDTVDAVNAFRLLLNKEFNQKLAYRPYRTKEFRLPGK